MQVKRTNRSSGYVQIPNTIARHGILSLEAVGLLTRLLSLPDGAGATVDRIAAQVSNGRRSVSKAMNELIEAGYVKRAKVQDPETGRWVTITTVTDTPEAPTDRFPAAGVASGRAVGASPIGRKTKSKKDITPPPSDAQDLAPLTPQSPEKGGEGEAAFLHKIDREMAREGRRILERLSLHKSLPLTDQEIARLAPKVVPWLREDYRSDEILKCLTAALPGPIDSVAGLISHRLKHFTPERSVRHQQTSKPVERVACEVCAVIFPLGHHGGVCRNCKDEMGRAASFLGV
ncbi:helix-turn-helix domain-containing protein [Streptomyces graminilatus]|uniref:helix-turn-helix domain-containing protein n=1 Tax=Streptomyces graminilatus TaxID=1464070 RepID=UPI000A49E6E9|nr:helix-turn-helix domain-containing protein [Streptomyces graminilatus]